MVLLYRMIDLRSDTVTRPTQSMRQAMSMAEVGDDVLGEDPTVNALEEEMADLVGKEAALFVPSGTMGNQIALHVLGKTGSEVILEEDCHIYNFEMGAMAALSGLLPRVLPSQDGAPEPERVENAIMPKISYRAHTSLITLENTHNLKGGRILPDGKVQAILAIAKEKALPVHLDGARLWHVAVATGKALPALTEGFTSVMMCFSKGLGAPVGSILLGSRAFIQEARRVRKLFGGGMRQVGVLAAAARVAVKENFPHLEEAHAKAKKLAEGLKNIPQIRVENPVETNIIIFTIKDSLNPEAFYQGCLSEGLLFSRFKNKFRMVTHYDVSWEAIHQALDILSKIVRQCLR